MGYELHITRQHDWIDADVTAKISFSEWKELVANDPDMRMDNYAEATTTEGVTISACSEGLAVWTMYSKDGIGGGHAWFSYAEGNIDVKNPDKEIINKMLSIAAILNAKVQGDDCEIYDLKHINGFFPDAPEQDNKPWWKFW